MIGAMHPWHDVPVDEAAIERGFPVVIEVPRGSVNKYELDKDTGLLRLHRVLHSAVHYPADYGFLPRSLSPDGDALDVLVLSQAPVHPLTLLEARAIGMFRMFDGGAADEKILAVSLGDPAWRDTAHHDELPSHIARQILRFFRDYKVLENKEVRVEEMLGPDAALLVIREALAAYRERDA